jgi:hypothetical protein
MVSLYMLNRKDKIKGRGCGFEIGVEKGEIVTCGALPTVAKTGNAVYLCQEHLEYVKSMTGQRALMRSYDV